MMITTSSITIPIGWWVVPALVTALVAVWLWYEEIMSPPTSGYGALGAAAVSLMRILFATVLALAVWLAWALAR